VEQEQVPSDIKRASERGGQADRQSSFPHPSSLLPFDTGAERFARSAYKHRGAGDKRHDLRDTSHVTRGTPSEIDDFQRTSTALKAVARCKSF